MDKKALTVTELATIVKQIFDAEIMLHDIDVVGEISGLSVTRDIAYFTVKDKDAMMSCVLFGASRYPDIKNGDSVVLTGTPRFYVKGGKLNFNVSKITPFGQGLLFKQFLELKLKLEQEGLFDVSHKKQIPLDVKTIGVVTSEGGAVIQDIINVSTRRNPQINIVLYPTKVQGVNAEKEIVKGIEFFSEYDGVDVVIVARGGGSMEDLQPYNTEMVARATYACKKPVVSAVGHETDFTIIDFVSDLRAPTPSAAAELVCVDKVSQIEALKKLTVNFKIISNRYFIDKQNSFHMSCVKLEAGANKVLNLAKNAVKLRATKMQNAITSIYADKSYEVGLLQKSLEKLNPTAVLQRGYAVIESHGKRVESVDDLMDDQTFTTYLKDGKIDSKVIKIERRGK